MSFLNEIETVSSLQYIHMFNMTTALVGMLIALGWIYIINNNNNPDPVPVPQATNNNNPDPDPQASNKNNNNPDPDPQASNNNKNNQQTINLLEKIETQEKTVKAIHTTVGQLLGGLFNQSTQEDILTIHLNNLFEEKPKEVNNQKKIKNIWPTTRQGDEHEIQIKELTNIIKSQQEQINTLINKFNNQCYKHEDQIRDITDILVFHQEQINTKQEQY
jgi:hypothetical protein